MRLGVIDMGSNTVHMLIVDAHPGAKPLPAVSHKIALRLSEHLHGDRISDTAIATLTQFLSESSELAEDQGAEELFAFATSAIREAANGQDVLDRIEQVTGSKVHVLSGVDESRMTFLAARRWFGWSSGGLLMLDIGGGSLEIATGLDEEPDAAISVPLGAGRVTKDLLPGDPPDAATIKAARRAIRSRLASDVRPILRAAAPDRVVAASKTFRSLARLAGAAPSGEGPYVERVLTRDALGGVIDTLSGMSAAQRVALPGVSQARSGQVLGGALVAHAAMDLLRVEKVTICPWALREGLILRRLDALSDDDADGEGWIGASG